MLISGTTGGSVRSRKWLLEILVGCAALSGLSATYANPAHDQVEAMSESQRRTTFATLLTKSGEHCPRVSRSFYQGQDKQGNAFWNLACDGGDSYLVQVNNDAKGSTRVLSCEALKVVGGGTCFKKF